MNAMKGSINDNTEGALPLDAAVNTKKSFPWVDVLEYFSQPFAVGSLEGRLLCCNSAFCELTGYTREELLKLSWKGDLTAPEWRAREEGVIKELQATGRPQRHELEYVRKDGRNIPVEILVHQHCEPDGGVLYYYAFVTDISARKAMETEIKSQREALELLFRERADELNTANQHLRLEISERRRLEEELRFFFDLSADMFFILNFDHQILRVNNAVGRIIGYDREELIGQNIMEFVHPQDLEESNNRKNWNCGNNLPTANMVNRFLCKDGSYRWLEWGVVADRRRKIAYAVGRDITERRQFAGELERLDQLNLIGQIAGSFGHEIRNPLTVIRGFVQLLRERDTAGPLSKYYDLILGELDRTNEIISEFLSVARKRKIELSPSNLNGILRSIAPLINGDALKSDKSVLLELGEIPKLLLNPQEIRQLILNLARNGLEAMGPGGVLTLKTYVDAHEVVLAVNDKGCGISPNVLRNLGTPFFTTKENGTGLGMAVCFGIAEKHNAIIKIDTGSDGTTFFVRFKQDPGTNHP